MSKQINIQDCFLNIVRKEKVQITVYLMNGFQFKGFVKSFDSFCIIMECDDRSRLVYKHAISTIVPDKNIEISQAVEE